MLPKIALVKKTLESLYQDEAIIYTSSYTASDDDGIYTSTAAASDKIPCRLSYEDSPNAVIDGIPTISQKIRLFMSPDVTVHTGADIDVLHLGQRYHFKAAGHPAVYDSHQEIDLVTRGVHGDGTSEA